MKKTIYSPERRASILKDLKASGMSLEAYSKSKGVPSTTIYAWIRKGKGREKVSKKKASFLPIQTTTLNGQNSTKVELTFADGTTLRIN
jgi:transposase-like protein